MNRHPVTHTYVEDGKVVEEALLATVPQAAPFRVTLMELGRFNVHRGGFDLGVIRDGHLGDLILMTAALRTVVETFKRIRLHVFCSERFIPVFDNCKFVTSTRSIEHDLDATSLPLMIDLRGYVETHERTWETCRPDLFAEAFGFEKAFASTKIVVTKEDRQEARRWLKDAEWPKIIIGPDASDPRREIDDSVYRPLLEMDNVLVVGHKRGAMPPIRVLFALIEQADVVVSTDNAIYHIAGAVTPMTRSIPLFTTVPSYLRCRNHPLVTPLTSDVPCAPCSERCKDGCEMECTSAFDVEEIERMVTDAIRVQA